MFSVVIPLWNKRDSVVRAVRSVLGQSFGAFELIVVDDGSTDGSADLVAAVGDPRLRLLRQANAGPGAARNAGIEAASNDWIAFLDADDLWLPDHLAELDRIRAAHPEAGLIGTAPVRARPGDRLDPSSQPSPVIRPIRYFAEVARIGDPLNASCAAIPLATYRTLGGFSDARLGEDSEYWARIALALPVAISSRATAVYMGGTGGAMESSRGRWSGVASAREITPALALIEQRYDSIQSEQLRRDLDAFVLRYLDWTLKTLLAEGDLATVRAYRRLYRDRPPATHRLLIALARLPRPLASIAQRLVVAASSRLPRLSNSRSGAEPR